MIAARHILPELERTARERQGTRTDIPAKMPESYNGGEARDQAALRAAVGE